jgi:hypothetical protein
MVAATVKPAVPAIEATVVSRTRIATVMGRVVALRVIGRRKIDTDI